MTKNVLNTDLSGKVAVVTGAGGVLCSDMAKTLARAGAKVALLNRTLSKAQVHADAIVAGGGVAKAYQCNVLVENDCNAIAPGFFASEQNARLLYNEDGTPTPRAEKILAGTPAGRMGRPGELEGALLFLVNNEAAGFINGIVLPVDGGFQAYSGV